MAQGSSKEATRMASSAVPFVPSIAKPPAAAKSGEKPAPKAEEKSETPAKKQVGHVATRMVDDALWALIGKKSPTDEAAAPGSPTGRARRRVPGPRTR